MRNNPIITIEDEHGDLYEINSNPHNRDLGDCILISKDLAKEIGIQAAFFCAVLQSAFKPLPNDEDPR